jgi:L-aminopeptidase/D-esterase-like protein
MTDPHLATPSGLARARAIPVPFEGTPGPVNAITDVPGLEVGYTTLISGEGPLKVGEGPVRTGVTAILPRGRAAALTPVFAAFHSFNGNGELSGCHWIEESGLLEGPITITNTHSCGIARDATVAWLRRRFPDEDHALWGLPVAGETYDGYLNDIDGFHVTAADVEDALDAATGGPLELGSVGGGAGMIAYQLKGGSGSASRLVPLEGATYTLGAFVQANYGRQHELTIAGVPVGRHLADSEVMRRADGSVIAVVATDAPLLPHQLKRLARRITLGIGRSGTCGHDSSGDIFLALSTANTQAFADGDAPRAADFLPNAGLDPLFEAVVQAVDEAVIDAMVANREMVGRDGHRVRALPHDELRALCRTTSFARCCGALGVPSDV